MNTLSRKIGHLQPKHVVVTEDTLTVELMDGRTISVPILWYPRLAHGTPEERNHFELGLEGIHWPDLDEDISTEALLLGEKSGEGPQSLQRWLNQHKFRQQSMASNPATLAT
jgi:hypothetical protein